MTPDSESWFLDRVRATILAHDLLPRAAREREPVVVGTSGGPDSVALLRALVELSRRALGIAPVVAHLHHGLRGESADADQAFVEDLARRLGLRCEVGRADVRAEAAEHGVGIEEAARLARRRFLAEAARRAGARKVALAHHADDRAETVLFNLLRGTGIEGLAALGPRAPLEPCRVDALHPPSEAEAGKQDSGGCGAPTLHAKAGIEIIRPLIDVRRQDVLNFLKSMGQDYREDATNRTDAHTRNRLRNELIPALRENFNPKVEEALVRLADQASAASAVLDDALDEVWRRIVRAVPCRAGALHPPHETGAARNGGCGAPTLHPPEEIIIDADDFEQLRPWMQGAIVRRAIDRLGGGLKHMSADRTREVVAALVSKTVAGPVDLPDGLAAERRRRAIRIGRREDLRV